MEILSNTMYTELIKDKFYRFLLKRQQIDFGMNEIYIHDIVHLRS